MESNKLAKNSHGSASVFVEEVDQWQPWAVDVACITVCCVNVRKESQLELGRKDDGDGCRTAREVAERSVSAVSFHELGVPPPPPQDTEKPQVMLLGSDDNLNSPSDSGNR